MHIAVISGGSGSERDISLLSGKAVVSALEECGYEHSWYDFPTDKEKFLEAKESINGTILMIHGTEGEDGQIAHFLESIAMPFQCESSDILALTIDKWKTKQVWREAGIPIAADRLVNLLIETPSYTGPCVIKAINEGSSVGLAICKIEDAFTQAIEKLKNFGECLIEEFIEGREITVSILTNHDTEQPIILPIVEIIPPEGEIFDYENKYNGKTQEICPAQFDETTISLIHDIATRAYNALGMKKYGRIDMIVDVAGNPICLEINTIPGFTSESLFPKAAKAYGMTFPQLIDHLVKGMIQ